MRRLPSLAVLAVLVAAFPASAEAPAAPGAAAPAQAENGQVTANPCSGRLSGGVEADFTCTVSAVAKDGVITFEIQPTGPVKGVKAFPPVVVAARSPLSMQEYTHRDLAKARASVTTSKGASFAASEKLADRGDLALLVQTLEMNRGETLIQAGVHAHLVPAKTGAKGEVQLDLQFETGYRAAP
ncbi:MAG TPA: hypothetical protein PLB02_15325 [Thermoanaerobaculia bacterium]|nr:hypothetical protein [Thermoanaerobaculia bacterium]